LRLIAPLGQVGGHRFVVDSPLEEAGFEPSVPQECRPRLLFASAAQPFRRRAPTHFRERDRWFESGSLQRGVRCKPDFREECHRWPSGERVLWHWPGRRARQSRDPVLQQIEAFGDPTISVNDCFRPVWLFGQSQAYRPLDRRQIPRRSSLRHPALRRSQAPKCALAAGADQGRKEDVC
jgi:hypothetical protein